MISYVRYWGKLLGFFVLRVRQETSASELKNTSFRIGTKLNLGLLLLLCFLYTPIVTIYMRLGSRRLCKWYLRSSGMLRSVDWLSVSNVSRQHTGTIHKNHAVLNYLIIKDWENNCMQTAHLQSLTACSTAYLQKLTAWSKAHCEKLTAWNIAHLENPTIVQLFQKFPLVVW
jgi:hypothetical protein